MIDGDGEFDNSDTRLILVNNFVKHVDYWTIRLTWLARTYTNPDSRSVASIINIDLFIIINYDERRFGTLAEILALSIYKKVECVIRFEQLNWLWKLIVYIWNFTILTLQIWDHYLWVGWGKFLPYLNIR